MSMNNIESEVKRDDDREYPYAPNFKYEIECPIRRTELESIRTQNRLKILDNVDKKGVPL